ncbi:MAG: 16S rRNA (adenine(1518)-N(6)/adenine(1519)-N(6))-dimethyltransferase RsmA, partial [Clostridiales Family XIII bacterium]|nr:16S rRNA (adenine(1518)-N(6)/adenine(1519)-N(6))-dimethyltransferase RsmA [Clostridiales Family XIII bacterium]
LLAKYDFRLSKNFGQNFLTDKNIIDKIICAAELTAEDTVLEIGSGFGALTGLLAQNAGHVIAVEIDKRAVEVLQEVLADAENTQIVCCDFMKYDLAQLPRQIKVIGNLPYYITTPILMKMLENDVLPERMIFMMQKEVAKRITSPAGCREYGAVSVSVQYYADAEYLMDVSREVFYPKPNVDSAVLRLTPKVDAKRPIDPALMFSLVKAGFGQRRKMLQNAFKTLDFSAEEIDSAFRTSGLDSNARAETLSVENFIDLADAFYHEANGRGAQREQIK